MFCKVNTYGLFGLNAFSVAAEITAGKGLAGIDIVGLPDLAVQETKPVSARRSKTPHKASALRLTIISLPRA